MKNYMKTENEEKVPSFTSQPSLPSQEELHASGRAPDPGLRVTAPESAAGGLDKALHLPAPARRLATGLEISPDARQWQGIS